MNTFSNIINRYDDMLYESRPSSLNEFINNKYNDVHNQLYNDALNKYIKTVVNTYINDKFIQVFNDNITSLSNYDNFDEFYDNYDKTDYVHKALESLSINVKQCIKMLYDIKKQNENIDNNILKNIYIDLIYKLYKRYHKIVEIKNSEYWMPSSIFIIAKVSVKVLVFLIIKTISRIIDGIKHNVIKHVTIKDKTRILPKSIILNPLRNINDAIIIPNIANTLNTTKSLFFFFFI